MAIDNQTLIDLAAEVTHRRYSGKTVYGQVGAVLVGANGETYRGVCGELGSGMGFCAEQTAAAAMMTEGETRIERVVAVWKDEDGKVFVLPPCGRCREFLWHIDPGNSETDVILGADRTAKLKDLLPYGDVFSSEPETPRKGNFGSR